MPDEKPQPKAHATESSSVTDTPGDDDFINTPAACEITIDGKKIAYDILRVELKQSIDDHHELQVRVRELGQQASDTEFSDRIPYTTFLSKSISLSIKPEGGTVNVDRELGFIGLVTRVEMENSVNGLNMAVITAHSPTIALDGTPRNNFYHDQSASDILGSIVKNYPITVGKTDSTGNSMPFIVQYRETDWDFVVRMATGAGLFAFYDGKEFRAVKPAAADEEELVWRETLGSFALGLGTAPMDYQAKVYNYEQSQTFTQDTKSLPDQKSLSDMSKVSPKASRDIFKTIGYSSGVKSASDARAVDNALQEHKNRALGAMIKGRGASIVPAVASGHSIKVKGMDKFDAQYLVTRVVHTLDKSGQYHNNFECVPLDMAHPRFISHRNPTSELQSAVVTDNKDPEQLGRVKVKFHWHDDDTPWLRIIAPGAGDDRGRYWLPEIDDEVLVAFEQSSPDLPVVLGSLYNASAKPPNTAYDDDNLLKVFQTKSGNRIVFNDKDGEESIEIITKSNSVLISEGSTPSMTVTTKGSLTFQSKQSLKIESQDLTLETKGNINIKGGGNVKIEATGNLDLKASGITNLEGSMTNVKGSLIKLN